MAEVILGDDEYDEEDNEPIDGLQEAADFVLNNLRADIEKLVGRPVTIHIDDAQHYYDDNCSVVVRVGYNNVASWVMSQLLGCCGAVISTGFLVYKGYQRKGLGKLLNQAKIDIAKAAGYSLVLITTTRQNEVENHILETLGYLTVDSFVNSRTTNTVLVWTKEI